MGVDFGRTNVEFDVEAKQTESFGDASDVVDHFERSALQLCWREIVVIFGVRSRCCR